MQAVSQFVFYQHSPFYYFNINRDYNTITSRECDEPMAHSASSASSLDSHAPSESSQSQGARWEEQQKVMALEHLCGVFRVDLGHMRSLRLFFRSVEILWASRINFNIYNFYIIYNFFIYIFLVTFLFNIFPILSECLSPNVIVSSFFIVML